VAAARWGRRPSRGPGVANPHCLVSSACHKLQSPAGHLPQRRSNVSTPTGAYCPQRLAATGRDAVPLVGTCPGARRAAHSRQNRPAPAVWRGAWPTPRIETCTLTSG
jgi:hypothetical protein